MSNRRPTAEHQAAASRRLALLSAELAGARPSPPPEEGHTRIREGPREPWAGPAWSDLAEPPEAPAPTEAEAQAEAEAPGPPAVPVPGRHASRRAGRGPATLVPEPLRGRVALGPTQLAVVALLVAAGLAVTCWWVVRGAAHPVEVPPIGASTGPLVSGLPTSGGSGGPPADATPAAGGVPGSSASPGAGAGAGGGAGTVTVDVEGKVRRPGIVVLDAGARVVDALDRAGGARRGVDLTDLNLARVLIDGEQLLVGVRVPASAVGAAPSAPVGSPGAALVDLNTADQTQLEALPEVGPVTAQAILTWRDQHGGFTSVDELLEVDGIGDATLAQIAPYVTV
jgi:competence protein ComEA